MASIHPQSSSMAGPWRRLAAVPEGGTDSSAATSPPCDGLYRDWIRTVPVSGAQRQSRSTMRSTISGHSGSSYYSASNSCPSDNSGYSSGSGATVALECFGNQELMRIARQMVSDGYIRRMVQAFHDASSAPAFDHGGSPAPGHALEHWFSELDVDWVLQINDEHGLRRLLRDKPATTQDLVDKWIRALTVIVASITFQTPAVAPFGKASITEMLDVVDVIITVLQGEKLRAVLDMFACVCGGASLMFTSLVFSSETKSIFDQIRGLLERHGNRLSEITASTMEEVKTLVGEDHSWAIEIPRGGGEVHKNTRFIVDCIVSIINTQTSMKNSAPSHNSENLGGLIDGTIDCLKGLLFTKSESCSDQSLRYLFLLNNSYFIVHVVSESSGFFIPEMRHLTLKVTLECKKYSLRSKLLVAEMDVSRTKKCLDTSISTTSNSERREYMDSYLDVSWGPVLSCIPKSRSPGLIHCLINTPSLAKFKSAFHKTYQAQQFWKVPDPRLRDALRRAIAQRVISGYLNYLQEHPELEKHVGRESSSPHVLEEMLGELFEG